MKRITTVLCLLLLVTVNSTLLHAVQQTEITADVKKHIRKRVDSGMSVGIIVGVIDAYGKRYYSYGT